MTCMNQQWHYHESGPHWGFEIVNEEGRTVAQVYADDLTGQIKAERIARLMAGAVAMRALLEYYAAGGMNDPAAEEDARAILARIDGTTP